MKFKFADKDYVVINGGKHTTQWQKCINCGNEVFTISPANEALCDECRNPKKRESESYKKQPIPDSIRWQVWERDNFTCQVCGSRKRLEVDHIYPESKGGTLDLANLQTLCNKCNSRKGAR